MPNWDSYGDPDLTVGPLEIWVHGREFPDSDDPWDGNWLRVSARCRVPGSFAHVSGSFLDTVSFAGFATELESLARTVNGQATLESLEPELKAALSKQEPDASLALVIEMVPDVPRTTHKFEVTLDQSEIPAILKQCEGIVERYPVRRGLARGL